MIRKYMNINNRKESIVMKKIFKVLLLTLAVVAVLAIAAAAADYTLYSDGTIGHTQDVSSSYTGTEEKVWISDTPSVATVSSSGVVTAVAPGECKIIAMKADYSGKLAEVSILVKTRTLTGIEITTKPTKLTYNSGDQFETAGMVVTNVYDNGDKVVATSSQYDWTPKTLTANTTKVVISSKIDPSIATQTIDVTVKELTVKSLELSLSKTAFAAGEYLTGFTIKATYSDDSTANLTSGYEVRINGTAIDVSSRKLVKTDTSVSVAYRGVTSNAVTITVTDTPVSSNCTAVLTGSLTKKVYLVGEELDWSGVTSIALLDNGVTVATLSQQYIDLMSSSSSYQLYHKFTVNEIGKTSITINFINNGKTYPIVLSGLTVGQSLGRLDPYAIIDFEFVENDYPIGYVFSLEDIYRVRYTTSRNGSRQYVLGDDLVLFEDDIALEVLDKNGKEKTRAYRSIIEEDDVFTEKNIDYVNVRLTINKASYDMTVEVSEASIMLSFGGYIIGTYDDIDSALIAADQLPTSSYAPTSLTTIKLGKDARVRSSTFFTVNRNIEIDLGGNTLEFYTDTINPEFGGNYRFYVTNTAAEEGTFTYYDDDVDLLIAKGETITFAKDYDKEEYLPGIYEIHVDFDDAHGMVTSVPEAARRTQIAVVPHGNKITITATPDSGYKVLSVAVGRTNVTGKDGYTKKNGVVTYEMRAVSDGTISVEFEKGEDNSSTVSEDWKNPFTDVKATDAYYDAVRFVYENELFKGVSDTRFSPTGTMTRAMFVTVLGRLSGLTETEATKRFGTKTEFPDVVYSTATSWYVPYITWAKQNGIIEGFEDGEFKPNNEITHQQMYVIMKRYASFIENLNTRIAGVNLTYTDTDQIGEWALDAVKYAKANQFIVLTGTNTISPKAVATRSELAMLLQQYCRTVLKWTDK